MECKTIKFFLILVTQCFSTLAMADQLSPYTADFDIFRGKSNVGTTVKTLSYPSAGKYLFTSETKIKVAVYRQNYVERSSGKATDQGVQPASYSLMTNNKMTFEKKDFTEGLQDNLSQLLKLRHDLLKQETPKPITLVTADGQLTYTFTIIDSKAELDTALGKLVTTQVRFEDNKGNQVDEWLAEKYQYLPVVVQISKGGKTSSVIRVSAFTPAD